ncbi:hypothetical protein AK812_SmicGene29548 [Symbiodinium microadriaticum]|uniref:Reverse transcriptase domain-containing protein n=1 Tax=Symbiodinium microadriaticum TaxID=2951 RepID=A0A1Q9D1J5_SYMMI|nr:hypothetical protein AK812_SmicGene29548 [Symbiodinium microadriaticum]
MNIQILLRAALKRRYPPGLLALAIPVHCGVRVLMAENMHSQFIQPLKGILAGCSLSVSLAKLYLWDMMEALQVSAGLVASDTWVDDLSFDLVDYNPERLAQGAVALYEDLADQVANVELQISVKKSGFLASHVAVATPLKRLVQAAQHKTGLVKQNRLRDHNLLLHALQGTLPTSHNGVEEVCSACGGPDASLKHKLWRCPAVRERFGPIPEVWEMSLDEEGLQSLWLRGLVPASLTALPCEAYVTEAQSCCVATGLWEGYRCLDASEFFFGTDGSGGPYSNEPRLRLCAWSVVAIRRTEPYDVLTTLGGPLPGEQQTVPHAEAYAMKMLFQYTEGAIDFCSDSQMCVRRLRIDQLVVPLGSALTSARM